MKPFWKGNQCSRLPQSLCLLLSRAKTNVLNCHESNICKMNKQSNVLLESVQNSWYTPLNLCWWKIHVAQYATQETQQPFISWMGALLHELVLSCIVSSLSPNLEKSQSLYADLPGRWASASTMPPPDILSTSYCPDLFHICSEISIKLLEWQ